MIKWQIKLLKKCYKAISSYDKYKREFFKNVLRFLFIDLQYYMKFRYTEYYNWESDILRSTLYCITQCSKELDGVVHTSDDLRYNYWLTEPHKMESINSYTFNILHRKIFSSNQHVRLLDLGSGMGLIFEMFHSYICTGYEINDDLVNLGVKMGYDIRKKDILKLTKEDVKDFDIIFFYEPITNLKDRETFAKNLSEIVEDNQIVIYNQGGGMINELKKYFNPDYIRNLSGGGLFHLKKNY